MFYFFSFLSKDQNHAKESQKIWNGLWKHASHTVLWHDMVPLDCVHFMYFQIIGIVISIMTYSTYLHHLFNYLHVSLTIKNEEIKTKNFINCLSLKKDWYGYNMYSVLLSPTISEILNIP